MARAQKNHLLQARLSTYFNRAGTRVLRPMQLVAILQNNQNAWRLPSNQPRTVLVEHALESTDLRRVTLRSENDYRPLRRYVWGKASAYEVALSIKADPYLSHETAMFMHGLTDRQPKTIYVNQEQGVKAKSESQFSQEAITRAFARAQRESKYSFRYDDHRIVVVSGKNTGNFEVDLLTAPDGLKVPATKLERTLVDIVVRPAYAGGVRNVMRAIELAKGRASISMLVKALHRLDHSYPFHQSLGFYMERAGYLAKEIQPLRRMGLKFDFYLAYGLKNPAYDRSWRIHYPKDL